MGRRPLGRPRQRWWDDIKMACDRNRSEVLVNAVMNLWVSLSGRTLLYDISFFLPVQEILIWPVHICCQRVVYLLVSQD